MSSSGDEGEDRATTTAAEWDNARATKNAKMRRGVTVLSEKFVMENTNFRQTE